MMQDDGPTAKVVFRVVDEDGTTHIETLWAYELGQDSYKLDNTPFYAYSVSVVDVVLAPLDEAEGRPVFRSVLQKSGNRTLRVLFDPPLHAGNAADALLQKMLALGCSYEGANPSYLCVTVPPASDFNAVCDCLNEGGVDWEHADPSYDALQPQD